MYKNAVYTKSILLVVWIGRLVEGVFHGSGARNRRRVRNEIRSRIHLPGHDVRSILLLRRNFKHHFYAYFDFFLFITINGKQKFWIYVLAFTRQMLCLSIDLMSRIEFLGNFKPCRTRIIFRIFYSCFFAWRTCKYDTTFAKRQFAMMA